PDRQRTLRGAIAWSYDLLDEAERRLFARLSIFSGGWTLASAEAVCDPARTGLDVLDVLSSLVDKSLIRRSDAGGDVRFSMLETIRQFGQEQLQARGDLDLMLGGTASTTWPWRFRLNRTWLRTTRSNGWTGATWSTG